MPKIAWWRSSRRILFPLAVAAAVGVGALAGIAATGGGAGAATSPVAGKYVTYSYASISRAGAAVYVNAMIKQDSPAGVVRSPARTVFLQRDLAGTWQNVLARRTSASGIFTVGFIAISDRSYRLIVQESATAWPGRSATVTSTTPPKALTSAYITTSRVHAAVYVNGMVKQATSLGIVRSPARTVYIQRYTGTEWQNILIRRTNPAGQFSVGFISIPDYRYRLAVLPSATATAGLSAASATTTPAVARVSVAYASSGGFPGATNTGPVGTLRPVGGNVSVAAGTVLSGVDIAGTVVLGRGAVLANSRVRCEGTSGSDFCVSQGTGSTLSSVEIGGGANGATFTAAIGVWTGGPGNTISHVDIHHVSDGLRLDGGTTVADSWIHDLVINQMPGVHSDGSQSTDSGNDNAIVFRHNTIVGGTNDAVFLEHTGAAVTVTGNLFIPDATGGNQSSYGVAVYEGRSVVITANVFARGWEVSPLMTTIGATIVGNVYTDGAAALS